MAPSDGNSSSSSQDNYDIQQYNIITDVLGGWSSEVDEAMARNCRHLSLRISSLPINEFMLMRQHGILEKIPRGWLKTTSFIFPSFYTSLPTAKEIVKDSLMWRGLLPGINVDWRAMITCWNGEETYRILQYSNYLLSQRIKEYSEELPSHIFTG